jgi:hypothetical protein
MKRRGIEAVACLSACLLVLSFSGLSRAQETLTQWNLGEIPSKSVWHGMPYSFLVQWEGHPACEMTMGLNPDPVGPITLEAISGEPAGRWKVSYNPNILDKFPFMVTLTGKDGGAILNQSFELTPMANLPPEQVVFDPSKHTQSGLIEINDPAPQTTIAGNTISMNYQIVHPKSVLIRRQEIVIDQADANGYYQLFDGVRDIQTMEMVGETVIIRSPLHLKQTNVIIRARELRMEGPNAAIITTPDSLVVVPGQFLAGLNGLPAGSLTLEVDNLLVTHPGLRFDLGGGTGQDGGDGADGVNGISMSDYWKSVSWVSGWVPLSWSAPDDEWIIYHELWNTCTFGIPIMVLPDRPVGGITTFPTSGTNATPSGKPGKGGAGGVLKTTLPNIAGYTNVNPGTAGRTPPQRLGIWKSQYTGGAAGWPNKWLKIKAHYCTEAAVWVTDSYNNHGGPTIAGNNASVVQPDTPSAGDYGSVVNQGSRFGWIDPVLMDLLIHRAKDLYLNGQLQEAQNRMEDLSSSLAAYMAQWPTPVNDGMRDLRKMYEQIKTYLHQISNNLDYYGNPAGWVPMLSFEVNTTLFDNEVDRAIDMLYLAHWIGKTNANQTQKQNALKELAKQLKDEIDRARLDFDGAMTNLGTLKIRAAEIRQNMDQQMLSLQALENQLKMQAAINKQTPWWKTGLKMAAVMCKVIPLVQPAAGYIGTGMEMAANFDPDKPYDTVMQGTKLVDLMVSNELDTMTAAITAAVDAATGEGYGDAIKLVVDKLGISKTGLTDLVSGWKKAAEEVRAPADKVQAELERLKALSPEFKEQAKAIEELQKQHVQFARDTAETILKLSSLSDLIHENLLALDTLREDLASVPTMDPRAAMYVQALKRRAIERLQKYHYYMAKAYEYRLLKPYTQPLNLDDLMDEFANTAIGPEGNVIPAEQFATLKGIYKDAVATVAEEIFTLYNNNRPELSAPVRFNLTADELAAINAGQSVRLNLMDMGIFPSNEENVRIVNFKVYEIETRSVGGAYEQNAYVDLRIEHSGLSKLMSNGQTYLFRHYNRETTNPITWGARYFPVDGDVNPIEPSAASASLLRSLLSSTASSDMMLYSRPSAWADLEFSLAVHNNAGKDIDLTTLRMELQYDFVPRNSQLRLCDIQLQVNTTGTTPPPGPEVDPQNSFMPYFIVNTPDKNQRSDARGWVHRIFPVNNLGLISITAQNKYGNWKFNTWTTQFGQDLPGGPWLNPTLQVVPSADKVYAAQYVPLDTLPGDLNSDCIVDFEDFAIVAAAWMNPFPMISGNGTDPMQPIGMTELMILAAHWGKTCNGELNVPAPVAPPAGAIPMDARQFEFVGEQ